MKRLTIKHGNYYCSPDSETSLKPVYDKLGKLEDIFELMEEMHNKPVYWKGYDGEVYCDYTHSTILYNPKTNEIEIYDYEFLASYKVEEYGITWWLSKTKKE